MNDEIQLAKMKQRCNVFSKVRSGVITNNPFFIPLLTKDREWKQWTGLGGKNHFHVHMVCKHEYMREESGFVQSDICQFKGTLKANFCSHVQAILDKIEISSHLIDETHFWLLIFVGKQFKGQFSWCMK